MKEIPLTRGLVALVDDEDHAFVSQWKWHAMPNGSGIFYAARRSRLSDGRKAHEPQVIVFMHRVLAGTPANLVTDHINGDGLDNRRSNLRNVTHTQNMQNRTKRKATTSQYKGVSWDKKRKKWSAALQADNKTYFIGRFDCEADAVAAYAEYAAAVFGQYNRGAAQ